MKALPSTFILSIIVFSMLVFGGLTMMGEWRSSSATYLDGDKYPAFNQSFNKLNDVNDSVAGLRRGIAETESDLGLLGVLNSLYNGAWNTLKGLFSSLSFMTSVWDGAAAVFGIHPYFAWLVSLLVTVLIAFGIYSAIFQREI